MSARSEELERIAAGYHLNEHVPDKFIEDMVQEFCCDWISTLIQASDRVIELGCGEGITIRRLSPLAARYTVVEGARSLVAKYREAYPSVEIVEALFEEYRPEVPCDKLLALHVFEHVDDPVALGRHLRGWLKPSGEMVVIVPNRDSFHRKLAVMMGLQPKLDSLSPRDLLVGHQRVYDLPTLRRDLTAAGFECLEERGFFLKTLPNGMMLDHKPELIGALNRIAEELPPEWMSNIALRVRRAA